MNVDEMIYGTLHIHQDAFSRRQGILKNNLASWKYI